MLLTFDKNSLQSIVIPLQQWQPYTAQLHKKLNVEKHNKKITFDVTQSRWKWCSSY